MAYDDPAVLGADGPLAVGAAIDRLAAADPRTRGRSSPCTGRSARTARSRPCSRRPAWPYTGSGVAASAIGMDKAMFKRLCRGLGLPVVDWREVRAARWAADPDAVLAELEAFAAGAADPRLMIKPARLGSSVGMTLVHDPGELTGALDAGVPLRHARARGDVRRRRPRPRGVGHRQRSGRARAVRPGRDRRPATSSTTTRRSTRPGLSERPRPRPRSARLRRAVDAQDRTRRLPGDRRRGLRPDRLPARGRGDLPLGDQHRSRVHPDQPVPDAAGDRRATRSPTSARRSSTLALERHAARVDVTLGPDDLPR